jgi:hypothetical protein
LAVTGAWLKEPEGDRAGMILHELVHIPLHQMVIVIEDAIKFCGDGAPLTVKLLEENLRRAKEAATCDVTAMLIEAIKVPSELIGPIAPSSE